MIINDQLHKNVAETEQEYFSRICQLKKSFKLTWEQLTEIFNSECGVQTNPSSNRSKWYRMQNIPTVETTLLELVQEVKKERVKLTDERTQNNAIIRRIAREETIKELGMEAAQLLSNSYSLAIPSKHQYITNRFEAILELSDWHYGICIDNAYNKYNPDIAVQRLTTLTHEVISKLQQNNIRKLHVVNLSDLISGRIHLPLRINSRFDVITQVIHVAELLANMLTELSKIVDIDYYDCDDNHSRVEPSKSDSLELETLTRIIHWYLTTRLKDNPNIAIHENQWGQDIITFQVFEHNVAGVHGDKDSPAKVLDNVTLMTRKAYDLCCVAHRHHFAADEKNCCIIISNGSLMGTDDYAEKLRLSASPSQNLIIVSAKNACECVYRILL